MKFAAAALLASFLLSACCTNRDAVSGPTLVTFEAHWPPTQENLPDVYDRHTIHHLLATKCIKRFVFDVKHGVPLSEVLDNSIMVRRLAKHNMSLNLTGKVLGPEFLRDTLPDFQQEVGAVDQYYIVRYDKEKNIASVKLVRSTKNLFQRCRDGDHIVARWIF